MKHDNSYPFQDPDLSIEERIDDLILLLTLEEKIEYLDSKGVRNERLGFATAGQVEGYHGAALGGPGDWGNKYAIPTTQFCQAIGLAETWEPELVRQAAETEAIEFRYIFHRMERGGLVVRSPNADLGRDSRWGRTEECYGEDPYLSGMMTIAFVKGLQGDHPKYIQTAALLKHFLANSNEDTRLFSSSDFDQRLFREYYSFPFMKGFIEGRACCYMTAYNCYNNIPCIIHPVIREITIPEWGVDGIICTDGKAMRNLVTEHYYCKSIPEAVAACIKAGITQFLDDLYPDGIRKALEQNLVSEADIDTALRPNFRVMMRLGLFDPPESVPYTDTGTIVPWNSEKHKTLVRKVTGKSIVLLRNEENILPLDKTKLKSIAVIGALADIVHGDWYGGTAPYLVTPLEGIRNKLKTDTSSGSIELLYSSGEDRNEAVALAKNADVVILCIGNHPVCYNQGWGISPLPNEGKEAIDRKLISLPDKDMALVKDIVAANHGTIVLLISSFPYAINWIAENVKAILHMTHSSQETGNALADVLFGDCNPAGRLVQTWHRSLDDLPPIMDYNIRNGRTYMYFKGRPLFHFGYGLSYTTFTYSNIRTNTDIITGDDPLVISVDVENTGLRSGDEVVQIYLQYPDSVVHRPERQLRGFSRIGLEPGEKRTVAIEIKNQDIRYWNESGQKWELESGRIIILAGSSSADADIKLRTIIRAENKK